MNLKIYTGVPTVAQWVKNPTAVSQFSAEARVRFPVPRSGLKDSLLPQLQLRFDPRPRNFHMLQVQPLKKKKKIRRSHRGSAVMNPTSVHEDTGLIPGLTQ